MDPLVFLNAALRVVHIIAATLWVGMGVYQTLFIIPAQRYAGAAGTALTTALYKRTPLMQVFPAVAITTTLAGLLLYATGSANHFSSLGNAVLGIGAAAGLAAAGHGMGLGKLTETYAKAAEDVQAEATSERASALETLNARLSRSVSVSLVLSVVALVFMASARYL